MFWRRHDFRKWSPTRVLAKHFLYIGFFTSEMRFDSENDLQKSSSTRVLAVKWSHLVTCSQIRVSTLVSTSTVLVQRTSSSLRFKDLWIFMRISYSCYDYNRLKHKLWIIFELNSRPILLRYMALDSLSNPNLFAFYGKRLRSGVRSKRGDLSSCRTCY